MQRLIYFQSLILKTVSELSAGHLIPAMTGRNDVQAIKSISSLSPS